MPRSWSDESLRIAVASNITISGVLRQLKLSTSPGNYSTVKAYVKKLGLDDGHFKGRAHGTSVNPKTQSLGELLVSNSSTQSARLRKKLLKAGLLQEECSKCQQGPVWHNEPLTLQLDHINGDPSDNRLVNLRIICPNCHTQTSNFTSKNRSERYRSTPKRCQYCQRPVSKTSDRCSRCFGKQLEAKTAWPSPEKVAEEVVRTSYVAVASRLGVSDTAVKKFLRRHMGHAPRKYGVKLKADKDVRVVFQPLSVDSNAFSLVLPGGIDPRFAGVKNQHPKPVEEGGVGGMLVVTFRLWGW